MKRLLRISFDTLITSLISILIWVVLSFTVDKSLINIFTLTFPIQYISAILRAIFGTGANISKEKGNRNDVMSGIVIGTLLSFVVFLILLLNLDSYLDFMNYSIDKSFVAYSIILIFLQTILSLVLTKLYYEGKNIISNKYSFGFNALNIISILITSLIFHNTSYIVIPTICILVVYVAVLFVKNYQKFHLEIHILTWIKYNSVELSGHVLLCLSYLFGLSNTVGYGENYTLALTFVALITDTQWDISDCIDTVAKIDISQNKFNFKTQLKDAYKLVALLIVSVLVMFAILYNFYNLDFKITMIFLVFHFLDFAICPLYKIYIFYLQLEYSTSKTTSLNFVSLILRLLLSFLRTPYCTVIAQTTSTTCMLLCFIPMFYKNFRVDKSGKVIRS